MKKVLLFIVALACLYSVCAHPTSTFYLIFTDANGNEANYVNSTVGVENTIYFHFRDMLHNNTIIDFKNFMLMHGKYVHLLFVSKDREITAHIHPDDFEDLDTSNITSVFFIKMTFPRGGVWSIGAEFMYNDMLLGIMREGVAETVLYVDGTPVMDPNPTWNYTSVNEFNSYELGPNDSFDHFIFDYNNTNSDSPIRVTLTVSGQNLTGTNMTGGMMSGMSMTGMSMTGMNMGGSGSIVVVPPQNINVPSGVCSSIYVWVEYYDAMMDMWMPAELVSYLDAPVHFTLSNSDNAVYHAHGTFLPPGMAMPDIQSMMASMTMNEMMDPTNPMYNLTMNAMMIGIMMNGTLNCFSDMGTVQMMMPTMNMSEYYGPSNFSSVVGIFNFPDVGNWSLWAFMKIRLPNGEEQLIVPNFGLSAYNTHPELGQSSMMSIGTTVTYSLFMFFVMIIVVFSS